MPDPPLLCRPLPNRPFLCSLPEPAGVVVGGVAGPEPIPPGLQPNLAVLRARPAGVSDLLPRVQPVSRAGHHMVWCFPLCADIQGEGGNTERGIELPQPDKLLVLQ